MREDLLNLIPDDILNLIWLKIDPIKKSSLSKKYFDKYYDIKFNNYFNNNKIKINLDYIHFIFKNDMPLFGEKIINFYIKRHEYLYLKTINYNNVRFENLMDIIVFTINHYNSCRSKELINIIEKKYKISNYQKKTHKTNNNNKLNKWKI